MKEWLLKDEKNKVGRPKLAKDDVLKKAKISIAFGFVISFIMMFSFFSILKGTSPLKYAYSLTFEKVFGMLENKDGFLVSDYYDDDSNYIMEFKVSDTVYNYSGNYKYTLYELNNNKWIEKESNLIDKEKRNFKIKIKSLKNQNKTWKIKLQIVNAVNIEKSYAPTSWYFNESDKPQNTYTYKIFTVKGYYSPVTNEEIKLAKKNTNKVTVTTNKNNPRLFILNLPNDTYDVKVYYTDSSSKEVLLANDKGVTNKKEYEIPSLNRSSKVTFKVYGTSIKEYKLSCWDEKEDSKGNSYITNSYVLKPEGAY